MKIGLYYSFGPHFSKAAHRLKSEHPSAELIAFVPPSLLSTGNLPDSIDKVVGTELDHYSPTQVGACLRLLALLRRERCDRFVVLFDTAQLQGLAVLSGAPHRLYCRPDGELVDLRRGLAGIGSRAIARRLRGACVYGLLWIAVRAAPVRSRR